MSLERRVEYFPPPEKFGTAWSKYLYLINKYVCLWNRYLILINLVENMCEKMVVLEFPTIEKKLPLKNGK